MCVYLMDCQPSWSVPASTGPWHYLTPIAISSSHAQSAVTPLTANPLWARKTQNVSPAPNHTYPHTQGKNISLWLLGFVKLRLKRTAHLIFNTGGTRGRGKSKAIWRSKSLRKLRMDSESLIPEHFLHIKQEWKTYDKSHVFLILSSLVPLLFLPFRSE